MRIGDVADPLGSLKERTLLQKVLGKERRFLDEIHMALRSRGTGTVSGEVYFDAYPDERVGGDKPIVGASVRLQSARNRLDAVTDARGEFRFPRVPPGDYELGVGVPKNATAVPPQRLVVGPHACLRRYFFSDPR